MRHPGHRFKEQKPVTHAVITDPSLLLKHLGSVRFSSVHQSCSYLIKNTVKMLLQLKTSVFYVKMCLNVMYFCDQSCIFSIITPVFSVTWSSEIILIYWFAAQETFLIIINVENIHIFVQTVIHFIFQDSQMNRKFKRTAFIWNRNLL